MLTTVVGNYPKIGPSARAPSLRTARSRLDRGRITEEELRRVEDETTREILGDQARAGVDLVTDGHIRWDDAQTYFASLVRRSRPLNEFEKLFLVAAFMNRQDHR